MAKRKTNPFWIFCTILAEKLRERFESSSPELEFDLCRDPLARKYYLLVRRKGSFVRLNPPFSVKELLKETVPVTFEQCLEAMYRQVSLPDPELIVSNFLTRKLGSCTFLRLCSTIKLSEYLYASRFIKDSWQQLWPGELGQVWVKVSLCGISGNRRWSGDFYLKDIFPEVVLEQICEQMRIITRRQG